MKPKRVPPTTYNGYSMGAAKNPYATPLKKSTAGTTVCLCKQEGQCMRGSRHYFTIV